VLISGERPVGSSMQGGSSLDLPDVFCSLGSLIVEGRLPTEGFATKGCCYYVGPHVELPGKISKHKCSETEDLVSLIHSHGRFSLLAYTTHSYNVCPYIFT
jgi:hypothetical protein